LWATHLVEELDHADRIILMVSGEVMAAGTPAELMQRTGSGSLTDAYTALTGNRPEAAGRE